MLEDPQKFSTSNFQKIFKKKSTRVKKNSNARVEREKNEKGRKHSELEWNRKKVQNISWNRWDLQKKKIFWFTNVDQT